VVDRGERGRDICPGGHAGGGHPQVDGKLRKDERPHDLGPVGGRLVRARQEDQFAVGRRRIVGAEEFERGLLVGAIQGDDDEAAGMVG
jgi:hypothetical protein